MFNSSFAPSASQLDTNEVDPVAEADVYIAYGRDAQAEEILKEALRTHPERYPVRLKLLEIYAARKDQRAFETQAGEMYGMTKGQGDDWAQAAALGLAIDPLNPLYASAADAAPVAAAATPEAIAEQAILNQMHDEGLAGADFDLMDLADNAPTALPEPIVAAAAPAEDHTLDFDLGGLDFEPIASTAPAAAAIPAADPHDLAFTSEPIAAAPAPARAGSGRGRTVVRPGLRHGLRFADHRQPGAGNRADVARRHAPRPGQQRPVVRFQHGRPGPRIRPAEAAGKRAGRADACRSAGRPRRHELRPADDSGRQWRGAGRRSVRAARSAPQRPPPCRTTPRPRSPKATPRAPQFDMSGIDLDLPSDATGGAEMAMSPASQADLSASHMEMETKLDLAIAYQEIGDKEGARELLDEVIKGGSHDQISKANDMRSKLA